MENEWENIENILFDGTTEEIDNLSCPKCNDKIFHQYNHKYKSLKYGCISCGKSIIANGCYDIPNCGLIA